MEDIHFISSEEKQYTLYDENPYSGTSYYRLRETDRNGSSIYSEIVSVNLQNDNSINVFPNPASDYVNVKFTLKETSSVTVDLMDISGNRVSNLISENGMKGDINKTFNVSSYSKGVYFLKIKDEKYSSLKKLIIE